MDDTMRVILALGPGTQLVKFDNKSVYRIVPVHPSDHLLRVYHGRVKYMWIQLAIWASHRP